MQDRRKINKCCMLYSICVFDAATQPQIGNLADITPQGAMIEGQEAITAGNFRPKASGTTQQVYIRF